MPIYEYACNQCGHQLEALQKMSEDPLTECPECGEASLRKKVSAAGFRLKGSGWYETDFKKDKKKNLAGDNPPDKSSAKDSTQSKTASESGGKGSDASTGKSSDKKSSSSDKSSSTAKKAD